MGGKALIAHGYDTVRLPTSAMRPIGLAVADALGGRLIPWIDDKPDHGDADVVVAESIVEAMGDDAVAAAVGAATGLEYGFRRNDVRDPVMAVAVDTPDGWFQVDVISTPDELADFSTRYLSYGDLGVLLGQTARQMGFLLGSEGFRLPIRITNARRASLMLTTDFAQALEFMGWDPALHDAGFADQTELVEFLASGRYFDPEIFQSSRMSSDGRRRSKRRPARAGLVEEISRHRAVFAWPGERDPELQRDFAQRALDHFGLHDALAEAEASIRRASATPEGGFSGAVVSEATGIGGAELQHLVDEMQKTFPDQTAWKAWKVAANADEVRTLALESMPAYRAAMTIRDEWRRNMELEKKTC
jgi:hypothetical protein